MAIFHCWSPAHTDEDKAVRVSAAVPEEAAATLAEELYTEADPFDAITIFVRAPGEEGVRGYDIAPVIRFEVAHRHTLLLEEIPQPEGADEDSSKN